MKKIFKMKLFEKNKYSHRFTNIDHVSYITVLLTAIMFFSCIAFFDNVNVYEGRSEEGTRILRNIDVDTNVVDENTPIGIKNQYTWTLNNVGFGNKYIGFYMVHQSTEVYIDGELIYSLKPKEDNKIGTTPANNWALFPILPEDEGKEICINIIPSYSHVKDLKVDIIMGTKFRIYYEQFKAEWPEFLLISMATIVGMIFLMVSVINKYKKKNNSNLIYLGAFSISVAIYKITDTKSLPLVFTKNTVVLSYISITMISVCIISFLISLKEQFLTKYSHIVEKIIVAFSIISLAIMFIQLANIADLRETLIFAHSSIGIISIVILILAIHQGFNNKGNAKARNLCVCTILSSLGVFMDLLTYYIWGNSNKALFTLAALVIYVILTGYMYLTEINRKANIDIHTGLFNKGRCNEILDENEKVLSTLGIMMFDLNKLKYINDNFGHKDGDLLISEFAKIIRNNINSKDFVGRFGGDEFMVVINRADDEMMKSIDNNIAKDVAIYNKENSKIIMSYSVGYALSKDYPYLSLRELLEKADEFMYTNKKNYYMNT